MTDRQELQKCHTDPRDRDTDDDGVLDGEEVAMLTSPFKVDTDGDRLADGLEVGLTTSTLERRSLPFTRKVWLTGQDGDPTTYASCLATAVVDRNHNAAAGLLLVDMDPQSLTDPRRQDSDGDGHWDGPNVWVNVGDLGFILRAGEDHNADGKCDPRGSDGVLEEIDQAEIQTLGESGNELCDAADAYGLWTSGDDESDPGNSSSTSSSPSNLGSDSDGNSEPDWLDRARASVTDATFWLLDGGEAAGRVVWTFGSEFTKAFFVDVITDNYNDGDKTIRFDADEVRNVALTQEFGATYINGMNNSIGYGGDIAACLNRAYGIPVLFVYNSTNNTPDATLGALRDIEQCVLQTGYNVFMFLSPTQLEKTSRNLYAEWVKIGESDRTIVHFAHSQGAIITAATLWRFRILHPKMFRKQLRMVVYGSGTAYFPHERAAIVPRKNHFVYTNQDWVYATVGGRVVNPLNWLPWSYSINYHKSRIINYVDLPTDPGDEPRLIPHSFWSKGYRSNTYGWWSLYVGGPIFQMRSSNHSVNGERWWLRYRKHVDWWNNWNVAVESALYPTVWRGDRPPGSWDNSNEEQVYASWLKKNITFNPRKAKRDED